MSMHVNAFFDLLNQARCAGPSLAEVDFLQPLINRVFTYGSQVPSTTDHSEQAAFKDVLISGYNLSRLGCCEGYPWFNA